mgnify:CR=1 FL=1
MLAVSSDQPDKRQSGAKRRPDDKRAEESVGPERIKEGKEWGRRVDVMLG